MRKSHLNLKILDHDYQRNGISGIGFYQFIILFDDDGTKKRTALATLTVEDDNPAKFNGSCRVTTSYDFNAHWRGDVFEEEIRRLYKQWYLK